jgi:hypothetical protein
VSLFHFTKRCETRQNEAKKTLLNQNMNMNPVHCTVYLQCTEYVQYISDTGNEGVPFSLHKKDAKQSEKDAKQNSELARLSETKQNKVRMPQFCLHEPLKAILNQKETCEK